MTNKGEEANIKAKSRSSKFLKDIGIYAIGNIGSKIITFMMVPMYTYFVHDTSDFGYYDLCLTVCPTAMTRLSASASSLLCPTRW